MFEKNTKEVNRVIARIFAACTGIVIMMVVLSYLNVFEFGRNYTMVVFTAGLIICISPSILIHFLPDYILKHYMMIILSIFIGILGTNNHIGIYMTYALVPIFSCLYFESALIVRTSIFSYVVMVITVYINTADKYEVVYMGKSHFTIFIAYVLGFTIEYIIISMILYSIVKRAKKLMEERYSAQQENRMKSEFLSSMSHEIRTPMNAILGMTEVALRKDMSDEVRKCLDVIRSSSKGLLEIVNDILDISRIETGKLRIVTAPYKTEALMNDMIAVTDARNIDKKVPIYYHIDPELPEVLEGDAVRMKQVMLNLASNAIKYTEKGRIDITVGCKDETDGFVKFIYTVKDTGQGIKEEDMDRLFVMYSQLDTKKNHGKEGAGIGLALCKSFADLMGGTISVESCYGAGSSFSFEVPQKKADKVSEKESIVDETKKKEANGWFTTVDTRVLLVDDNELNREVEKAMLEPLKMVIDEAEDGAKAVDMVKHTQYDLIFMDSHMPVMNGEEATKKIRQMDGGINRDVPIIAVTADAITGVRERLLQSGMDDYIVKPFRIENICEMIRKYLPEDKIKHPEEKLTYETTKEEN